MMRFIPPAGAPVRVADILRGLVRSGPGNGVQAAWLNSWPAPGEAPHAWSVGSGRAALWLILRSLQQLLPGRSVVAVPAYTCFTVPAAIARAGLKVHPVDIIPDTLDFDLAELEAVPADQLLCIVPCNLFGLMNDMARIVSIARSKGAFVVDDAAQALGARRQGRWAGTQGDVGLYSFGRGKPLACGEGGAIVTASHAVAAALQQRWEALPAPSAARKAALLAQNLATSFLLHPRLYWIPNSFPFLKLGSTEYSPEFAITSMPGLSQALLARLLERLEEIGGIRRRNAAALRAALAGNPNFVPTSAPQDCEPSYVRFPLLAAAPELRDLAVRRLRAAGIGASPFYPSAICDIVGIEQHLAAGNMHRPRAEDVARRLLTLPTHPYVCPGDVERMTRILNAC